MKNTNLTSVINNVFSKYAPFISHDSIAIRAYEIWLRESGDSVSNWLKAENELKQHYIEDFTNYLKSCLSPITQELYGRLVEISSDYDHKLACNINSYIRKKDDIENFILADNLKFYRNDGDQQLVVLEDNPKIRTLYIDLRFNQPYIGAFKQNQLDKYEGISKPVTISLPYIIYSIYTSKRGNDFFYKKMQIAFSNTTLKKFNQMVHLPLLPNIGIINDNEGGYICDSHLSSEGSSPIEVAQDIITQFWQNQFNYMLFDPTNHNEIETFENWEIKTKENPFFALNVNWPTKSYDFGKSINFNFNQDDMKLIFNLKNLISYNKRNYIDNIQFVLDEIFSLQPFRRVL